MLQKHTSDLVGRNLDGFLNFSCKKAVLDALQKTFERESTPKAIEISFKGIKNDDLAAYISPLQEDERVIGAIVHFLNTSEQKKMEIQFVHSQRMQAVGQLAGGVAHDFNNLLTAMIGFCDLLLQRHSPAEQSFSDIMQIKQNANRAAGLVRQLLAFSRQQSLQPKVINITDALSELSALLRRLLGPAIELKVKHARDLWFIKVDKGQFEQVVINLAVNARDAMENNGILKITTSNYVNKKTFAQNHDSMPPGEYVLIEIEDSGCGISMDIIDRIFEPFFSTKAVGSGTGLGLSTVYGIVKQTGGFIFVDSAVSKGTNFRIFLPRHVPKENEDSSIQEDKHLSDLTGTAHILLVEDEDAVRMFAARALKDKGYEVIEASNGVEAIQLAKRNDVDIDLIITDVVMPGMDGPQMINELRKIMPSVKVVFISGYAEDSFRKKLHNEDNIHFLPKPFNLKDLALKVKDILS
jgi:two-component system cell cycle sensor histidine kinase/response regulator CckA